MCGKTFNRHVLFTPVSGRLYTCRCQVDKASQVAAQKPWLRLGVYGVPPPLPGQAGSLIESRGSPVGKRAAPVAAAVDGSSGARRASPAWSRRRRRRRLGPLPCCRRRHCRRTGCHRAGREPGAVDRADDVRIGGQCRHGGGVHTLWNSLRAGRRRQAHGLARGEETRARDSVAPSHKPHDDRTLLAGGRSSGAWSLPWGLLMSGLPDVLDVRRPPVRHGRVLRGREADLRAHTSVCSLFSRTSFLLCRPGSGHRLALLLAPSSSSGTRWSISYLPYGW